MRQRVLTILLTLLCGIPAGGTTRGDASPILIPDAIEWCDKTALGPIEGIWEYPEDGVKVMIKRSESESYKYNLLVLESEDPRLEPGMVLGTLTATPEVGKFRLSQYRQIKGGVLSDRFNSLAELVSGGMGLKIIVPEIKFKFNPSYLLPKFLRIVRFQISNPDDKIATGLIKIYPKDDMIRNQGARPL